MRADYTKSDHEFRSRDQYAQGKYELTLPWIAEVSRPGERLVNLGCGSGDFNLLAVNQGYSVAAYEPDAWAAAEAAKLICGRGGSSVTCAGLQEAAETERDVSLLVMHDVLEHIERDEEAVKLLAGMIRPGGHILVTVPAQPWLFGRHDEDLGHYRRYSRESLAGLFYRDFDPVRIRAYGFLFIPVTFLFSVLLRRPYPRPGAGKGFGYFLVRMMVSFEKRFALPWGTSLMLLAKRK